MTLSSCSTCGNGFNSVSVDDTGTLAICTKGHHNFEAGSGDESITTGRITVTGQSAIGNGATVIGRKARR
ncbi:hypothetical protein [Micromonospora humida]|uniref:Uncharacterized protein n=1 Tax=Micromonospora humida TaxID=2809018 RepID=A0ABS2J140_9ACTN|nr:hypothetical protein [Micromonospora humida]MBM7079124.1 hypothetical protein [Micromonospora humida]